ncbi:MAG: YrhB domain-containing protein [Myxococcota bacterium]
MYSYEQALSIVSRQVARQSAGGEEHAVDEGKTTSHEWGWVFVYDAKKYIETGDVQYALMGNGPILFNKHTGEVRHCGSTHPPEHYVEEYEAELTNEDRDSG